MIDNWTNLKKIKYVYLPLHLTWGSLSIEEKEEIINKRINNDLRSYAEIKTVVSRWDNAGISEYYSSIKYVLNRIFHKLHLAEHVSILEIGPGTGELIPLYLNHFRASHYTALDIAPTFLNHIEKERISDLRLFSGYEMIEGNIRDYNFKRKYDLIVFSGVLHHIPFRIEMFKRLRDYCSIGAAVVVVDGINRIFHPLTLQRVVWGVLRKKIDLSDHCHMLTEYEIRHIAETSGFRVEDVMYSQLSRRVASIADLFRRKGGEHCDHEIDLIVSNLPVFKNLSGRLYSVLRKDKD